MASFVDALSVLTAHENPSSFASLDLDPFFLETTDLPPIDSAGGIDQETEALYNPQQLDDFQAQGDFTAVSNLALAEQLANLQDSLRAQQVPSSSSQTTGFDPTSFQLPDSGILLQTILANRGFGGLHVPGFDYWLANTAALSFSSRQLTLLGPGNVPVAHVNFSNLRMAPPTYEEGTRIMTPAGARLTGETYESKWTITMTLNRINGPGLEPTSIETMTIPVGRVPIMVGSSLCVLRDKTPAQRAQMGEDPDDLVGYFVVAGKEKVLMAQEHLALNKFMIISASGKNKDEYPSLRATLSTIYSTKLYEIRMKRDKNVLKFRVPSVRPTKSTTKITKQKNINALRIFRWCSEEFRGPGGEANIRKYIELFLGDDPVKIRTCMNFLTKTFAELNLMEDEDQYLRYKLSGETPGTAAAKPVQSTATDSEAPIRVNFAPISRLTPQDLHDQRARIINDDLFPHLNELLMDNRISLEDHARYIITLKLYMHSEMIARYLEYLGGYRKLDNKNEWPNKRTEGPPRLMEMLIRNSWRTVVDQTQLILNTKIHGANDLSLTKHVYGILVKYLEIIRESIRTSFVTGIFGVKNRKTHANYVQTLERGNIVASISHIETLDVPVSRTDKKPEIRAVKQSSYGFIDAADTPDGDNIGIVKKYSMTTKITQERSDVSIILLNRAYYTLTTPEEQLRIPVESRPTAYGVKAWPWTDSFWVYGKRLGWCDAEGLRTVLIQQRRNQLIHYETSIVHIQNRVEVDVGPSRIIRPLLLVDPATQELRIDQISRRDGRNYWHATLEELMLPQNQAIEYLSAAEQEYVMIATLNQYLVTNRTLLATNSLASKNYFTHMECDPKALYGMVGSLVPYSDYNQAPRTTYQIGMQKQGLCAEYLLTRPIRFGDGKKKNLVHGQRPLVETQTYRTFGLNNKGSVENVLLALAALPYTEEDSFLVNKSFLQMGGMRYTRYTEYSTTVSNAVGGGVIAGKPIAKTGESVDRYKYIGDNGLPMIGAPLRQEDCVIGRIMQIRKDGIVTEANDSVFLKIGDYGIVDSILVHKMNSETRIIVKLRVTRDQHCGDKSAGRYAQKNTIGYILRRALMFYNHQGMTPNVVQNPHAIISRGTGSQLLELRAGTAVAFEGVRDDASPFIGNAVEKHRKTLRDRGYDQMGTHRAYSGLTGAAVTREVNMGFIGIQVLHHHALEKWQVRATGPIRAINKQPTKGKANGGGLRFGEMEKDAGGAVGAAKFLWERLFGESDYYVLPICKNCGINAVIGRRADENQGYDFSCPCCNKVDAGKVPTPFVLVWLISNLGGLMGIAIRFGLDEISYSRSGTESRTVSAGDALIVDEDEVYEAEEGEQLGDEIGADDEGGDPFEY